MPSSARRGRAEAKERCTHLPWCTRNLRALHLPLHPASGIRARTGQRGTGWLYCCFVRRQHLKHKCIQEARHIRDKKDENSPGGEVAGGSMTQPHLQERLRSCPVAYRPSREPTCCPTHCLHWPAYSDPGQTDSSTHRGGDAHKQLGRKRTASGALSPAWSAEHS